MRTFENELFGPFSSFFCYIRKPVVFLLVIIYVAFVGLGIPDSILGAAWPLMRPDFGVSLSGAGVLSIISSVGTIVSSLVCPGLLRRMGTEKVVLVSMLLTAVSALGFGMASTFWLLCVLSVPMGVGAGAIDVAPNDYAAVRLEAKHTNWLHASWGVGAALGPAIFSVSVVFGGGWRGSYEIVAAILLGISVLLLVSFPVWGRVERKKRERAEKVIREAIAEVVRENELREASNLPKNAPQKSVNALLNTAESVPALSANVPNIGLWEALRVPGMKLSFFTFFFYSAIEISTSLWCGTYLVGRGFSPEAGAACVSLMFASVMLGRILSGFFAIKFTNLRLIHAGVAIVIVGCFVLSLNMPLWLVPVCVCLLGLGCAPVYPALIHATPARFGEALSGRAIGIQMAGSYVGAVVMPPLFGFVASRFSVMLLPIALAVFVGCLFVCVEWLDFVTRKRLKAAFNVEIERYKAKKRKRRKK